MILGFRYVGQPSEVHWRSLAHFPLIIKIALSCLGILDIVLINDVTYFWQNIIGFLGKKWTENSSHIPITVLLIDLQKKEYHFGRGGEWIKQIKKLKEEFCICFSSYSWLNIKHDWVYLWRVSHCVKWCQGDLWITAIEDSVQFYIISHYVCWKRRKEEIHDEDYLSVRWKI